MKRYDAVVVGSGPNGFAAAILMQRAGLSVVILEAEEQLGGGVRSAELTLPGFVHDIGSAIHPLGMGSPFLSTLPLDRFGLKWVHPDAPLAHPLDGGQAFVLERSVADTAAQLGVDRQAYINLMQPVVAQWDNVAPSFLGPLRWPKHPLDLTSFGLRAMPPATMLANWSFKGMPAKALFAGLAAHSMLPLEKIVSAAAGLVLGALGHVVGWPFPRGGSQQITNALHAYFTTLGGEVVTGHRVRSIADIPPNRATLFDISPQQLLNMRGLDFPTLYRRQLERFKYNQGIFKVDWALSDPIPFTNQACNRAATVHLGGTMAEIAASERMMWRGQHSDDPYVLLVQQSTFDPSRAPAGKHTAWAYCHVPRYSKIDMTEIIEKQVERFAPGFRETILGRPYHEYSSGTAVQRQLYRGRYQRGSTDAATNFYPTHVQFNSLPHAPRRSISLLSFYAPRRRGARNVWVSRG